MSRILLTGASRGIGARLAVALAPGNELVLTARDAASLERVAQTVRAAGGKAVVIPADVADEADRERLVREAGELDALINNAGVEHAIAVVEQQPADIVRQVQINLVGPMLLTRAVLPGMIARGRGAIVMVSSMSGKSPTPYNAIYAGTKHGINGFTSSLRIELEGTGVHAGVVCPSFVAEAGMWADTGVRAPPMLREVTLDAVVAGVRAVLAGRAEVLVTPTPVRPLLALAQLWPALDALVLRKMGVLDVLRGRARAIAHRP